MLRTTLAATACLSLGAAAFAQPIPPTPAEAAGSAAVLQDLLVDPATQAIQTAIAEEARTAAEVEATAEVAPPLGPKVGMTLETEDNQTLGRIVDMHLNAAGDADSIVVETSDKTLYRVPVTGLTFHGNTATTTRKQSEFNALPRVQ